MLVQLGARYENCARFWSEEQTFRARPDVPLSSMQHDALTLSMHPARRLLGLVIEIVELDAERTDELVRLWRESFEFGVGVVDPHPIEEQREFFVNTVVPNNSVRMALLDDRARRFHRGDEGVDHASICARRTSSLWDRHAASRLGKELSPTANFGFTLLRVTQSLARSTKSTDSKSSLAVSSRIGNWPISSTNGQQQTRCYEASLPDTTP